MKPIKERLSSTKPKDLKKINKAFEDGGCGCYQEEFMNEVNKPSALDFPRVKCIVTDNYFCCYELFDFGLINTMTVVPISQIVKIYRTNIDSSGAYDHSGFYLAMELTSGFKKITANVARDQKGLFDSYDEVINCVRSRMTERNLEV